MHVWAMDSGSIVVEKRLWFHRRRKASRAGGALLATASPRLAELFTFYFRLVLFTCCFLRSLFMCSVYFLLLRPRPLRSASGPRGASMGPK